MAQNNRGKRDLLEQEENVSSLFITPFFQQVMDTRADKPVNVLKLNGQHREVIGVKLRVRLNGFLTLFYGILILSMSI